MRINILRLILLLSMALFFSGCGSDQDITFQPNPIPATVDQPFAGKVWLGIDIPEVKVTLESLDGQVLAEQTTTQSGNFLFRVPLPPDFRVAARVADGLVFYREIRGFGTGRTFGAVTVPTTIASLISQARPGQSLASIEEEVRQGLNLRADQSLAVLSESVNEQFSHLAFFVTASERGGIASYLQQVVDAGGRVEDAPFLLRAKVLDGSLANIPSKLNGRLLRIQKSPRIRMSTQRLLSRGLADSPGGAIGYRNSSLSTRLSLVNAQEGELLAAAAEDLLEDVGEDVVDDIISDAEGDGGDSGKNIKHTWTSQQLQGHFGSGEKLAAISAQLSGIQTDLDTIISDLNQLAQDFNFTAFEDVLKTANEFSNDIKSTQNSLIQTVDNVLDTAFATSTPYFTNTPNLLPNNVASVVSQLQDSQTLSDLTTDVDGLQNLLTGSNGPGSSGLGIAYPPIVVNTTSDGNASDSTPNLVLIQRDQVLSNLGVSTSADTQRFGNFPVRSAAMLDQSLGSFEAYGQSQILGANLIAEAAHQSSSPQPAIVQAEAYAQNVARTLRNSRAQLPDYPLSDDYFIDLQNGLQWYACEQEGDFLDAYDSAQAFDDGYTTGWRLASTDEIRSLLIRAAWASGNGESYQTGDLKGGLEALGFQFNNTEYSNSGQSTTVPNWNNFGGWSYQDAAYFEYSKDPAQQSNVFGQGLSQGSYYFYVRTLGTQPTLDITFGPNMEEFQGSPGTWPGGFEGSPIDSELPSVGSFLGFSSVNVPDLVVELTGSYQIFTGDTDGYQLGQQTYKTTYARTAPSSSTSYENVSELPPVYFQTIDLAGSTVSNFADTFGQIINHFNSTSTTTINYFTLGYDPNGAATGTAFPAVISGSVPFAMANTTQVTLKQLQITPRNYAFDLTSTGSGEKVSQQFIALGFYSDQTVQDLTSRVTWSVIDTDTNAAPTGVVFSTSPDTLGTLEVTNETGLSTNLSITATIDEGGNPSSSGTDSTAILVNL